MSGKEEIKSDTIILVSSDDVKFEVEKSVAMMAITIKNMLQDVPEGDNEIPLPNVEGKVLEKILVWMRHYNKNPIVIDEEKKDEKSIELNEFDTEFCKMDDKLLFDSILSCNYLDLSQLLNVLCKKIAGEIRGKSVDQIRERFGIINDFSEDEMKKIKEENAWVENSS